MRIGLHRGRREVPLTPVRCPRPCGSARALEMGRRGLLWSAIGLLRRQHAVVQSRLPSHWDDSVAGCCLAAVCSQPNVSFAQVSHCPSIFSRERVTAMQAPTREGSPSLP
jgi:hypothetical protein